MDKNYNRTRRPQSGVDYEALGKELGHVPPQATDIEKAVLGAMMVEESAAEMAIGELIPESFYQPRHRIIFEAMRDLYNEKMAVDYLTVSDRLRTIGKYDEIGGSHTLTEFTNNVGSAAHVKYHIGILKQKAIQRGLISASCEIQRMAYDDMVNVDDLMVESQAKVYDVIKQNLRNQTCNVKDMLNDVLDVIQDAQTQEGHKGIITGFPELDKISMGWQKGNLVVIGARPGVGKTAIALNLAANAALRGGVPVAFFSLEMTKIEIILRLVEAESEIPGDKIKGIRKMVSDEWVHLESKTSELEKCDIFIDDTPAITTTEFVARAKNLVHTNGVQIIFIDYLQLMKHPGAPNVREEVSEVSHRLKATAKELEVPIIALAQLNRQVDQRRVGGMAKPILSDIKESGSIEQDADIVMFIHRPDQMGLYEDPSMKEYAEIIVAKNRNGAVRTIPMVYKEEIVKFKEPDSSFTYQAYDSQYSYSNSLLNNSAEFE